MPRLLVRAAAIGAVVLLPGLAQAAAVRVQNANLDTSANAVIVKAITDAVVPGTPVYLYNAETGALMGSDLDGNKQVNFRIVLPAGVKAPCTVVIRAGESSAALDAVTAIAQVRHATGCTAQVLSLAGQVTDAPIPYATVTVTLNGVTYTTVADANGFYTLDIASATVSELVTIEATKKMTSGETIDFVSLAGSFSKLLESADGGVLSSDTAQKVNVTNVSTAEYVLLVEANGGTAPTTVEELQQAETRVDATELLQLAAVIKLIVDDPNYSLPSDTTILQFLQQPGAVEAFVATVPPETLDAVISEILADNGLVAGFQVGEVPARYYVTFPAEPRFLSRGGDVFEFGAVRPNDCAGIGSGCTGTYLTRDVNGRPIGVPTEWYIEAGSLEVAVMGPTALSRIASPVAFEQQFPNAVMKEDGSNFALCNTSDTLNFKVDIVGFAFTRFNDGQTVDSLSQRSDLSYRDFLPVQCADGSLKTPANLIAQTTGNILARDSGSIAPRRFVRASAATGAADEIVADGQWALQVYANLLLAIPTPTQILTSLERVIFADNVRLNSDGSASSDIALEFGGGPSSWTTDASTGELLITYPDGWTQRVVVTDELDSNADGAIDQYGAFSFFSGPGGARYASSDPAFRRDTALIVDANMMATQQYKYWQTVVNAWTPDAWEDVPGSTTGERRLKLNDNFFGFRAMPPGQGFRGRMDAAQTCASPPYTPPWIRNGFTAFGIEQGYTPNVVAMRYQGFGRTRSWSVLSTDTVPNPTVTGTTQRRINVIEVDRYEALSGEPHVFPPRVNFYREFTEPSSDRGACVQGFNPAP